METTDAAVISVTDRSALYLREKCKKNKTGLSLMPSSIGLAHILQSFFRKVKYYEWRMRTIMHGVDNQVVVDAVGEDDRGRSLQK